MAPVVEMRGISKAFPGVQALDNVDLTVNKGEILCVLGENGAGKSTLMKILAGAYSADSGTVLLNGEVQEFKTTQDGYDAGISTVYQELNLCSNLTAMENIFLGRERCSKVGLISYQKTYEETNQLFRNLGVEVDPRSYIEDLGVANQQMVEIAKALSFDAQVIIMDEPTSSLTEREIETLFGLMRRLKENGVSMIFISHKLGEVFEIADRVSVLRDGKLIGERRSSETTENELIGMMVGRELGNLFSERKNAPTEEPVLEVRGMSGPPKIENVSFSLRKGEILGLSGLVGAGRTELAMLLMGAEKKTSGQVFLHGKEVDIRTPADAVNRGIGYVSEDRKQLALILEMTVRENITMAVHNKVINRYGFFDAKRERVIAREYIDRLRIKVSSQENIVESLSGGNQQKVVISKWLATEPEVLILDEPTRGIDVGAKVEVHKIITDLADRGVSIILISSEMQEVLALSDRILVIHEGKLKATLDKEEASQEKIMSAALIEQKQK
ncbi:MAG: sugar ABC transporter ATP-binding protein [Spirochaetaceae bacterium]